MEMARPKKAGAKTATVGIAVTPEQKEVLRSKARVAGKTLSEWLLGLGLSAAGDAGHAGDDPPEDGANGNVAAAISRDASQDIPCDDQHAQQVGKHNGESELGKEPMGARKGPSPAPGRVVKPKPAPAKKTRMRKCDVCPPGCTGCGRPCHFDEGVTH